MRQHRSRGEWSELPAASRDEGRSPPPCANVCLRLGNLFLIRAIARSGVRASATLGPISSFSTRSESPRKVVTDESNGHRGPRRLSTPPPSQTLIQTAMSKRWTPPIAHSGRGLWHRRHDEARMGVTTAVTAAGAGRSRLAAQTSGQTESLPSEPTSLATPRRRVGPPT